MQNLKLSDVCHFLPMRNHVKTSTEGLSILELGAGEHFGNYIDTNNVKEITLKKVKEETFFQRFELQENDILITVKGALAKTFIARNVKPRTVASMQFQVIRVTCPDVSTAYVFDYLNQEDIQAHLLNLNQGAILKAQDLKELPFKMPESSYKEKERLELSRQSDAIFDQINELLAKMSEIEEIRKSL